MPADWASAKSAAGQGLLLRKPRVCDGWFSEAAKETIWWVSPICWCRPTVPPGSPSCASSASAAGPAHRPHSPAGESAAAAAVRAVLCGLKPGALFVFPDPNGAAGGHPAGPLVCGAQSGQRHLLVDHVRALARPLAERGLGGFTASSHPRRLAWPGKHYRPFLEQGVYTDPCKPPTTGTCVGKAFARRWSWRWSGTDSGAYTEFEVSAASLCGSV